MTTILKYIIIDDDAFSNTICRLVIKNTLGEVEITSFSDPEEALEFIQNEDAKNLKPTILFLDINMHSLTAWEFIKQFEEFNEDIKKQISIYILSSSIDQRDKDNAKANRYIKGFISKPLKNEMILAISGAELSVFS